MGLQLPTDSAKVYIKNFNSGPIEIKLSIITSAKFDMEGVTAQKNYSLSDCFLQYGLNCINTNGASIQLNALEINNIFGSQYHISNQLISHYIQRAKKNILRLVFSVNMFGDPVSFISHIGTGVKDFFYEPKKGFIKGPLEGGKGILKGTYSLLKNPLEGSFDTVSKFLSSMSKGLLYFTDDQSFINQRQEEINLLRPQNPIEGLGFGMSSALTGVAQGITGVIEKPLEGAKSQGLKGLMTGTLKGLGGLVLMPVSGAIDLVSKTSEGFKNMISSDERQVSKVRIMRPFYGDNQSIKIYYGFHAYIIQHLIKLNRLKYVQDRFLDAIHYDQNDTKHVIIFTEENFILVDGVKKQLLFEASSSNVDQVVNSKNISSIIIYFKNDLTKPPYQIVERGQLKRESQLVNVDSLKIVIQDQGIREAFRKKIENYIRRMQEKKAIQINNQ